MAVKEKAFDRDDPSGIQDGAAIRNCRRARELALQVIDDSGQLDSLALSEAISALQQEAYSLLPEGHRDGVRNRHMLDTLYLLQRNEAVREQLDRLVEPIGNGLAEQLIRDALHLPESTRIDGATVKRAVVSAWLTYLRQNVGSCFATAPAIAVQQEQPLRFFLDMAELIATGKLTRVVRGFEHTVPLSLSWGQGDLLKPFYLDPEGAAQSPGLRAALGNGHLKQRLGKLGRGLTCARDLIAHLGRGKEAERAFKLLTENALLKAWEFTLASFSESKTALSRWNFYSALGLNPEEAGGLGAVLYSELQEKLNRVNRQLEELEFAYESAFAVVKTAESRLRRATASDASWLQSDYKNKVAQLDKLVQERDGIHRRGQKLAGLAAHLVEEYNARFPEYFQEIYDAEMADVGPNPFDDAPAGFRLLYKHGRSNPALWTLVHTPEQFVDALVDFFVSTEAVMAAEPRMEGLERELSDLVTTLVTHARTDSFLESALYRMAKVHGGRLPVRPLHHLDQVDKKPWAYVSGGTMSELVRNYFGREDELATRERLVESPTDLFVFLLEAMKELPPRLSNPFVELPNLSLLIQSPTHAFLFKPGLAPFRDGWLDRGNSYTWVRDQVVRPQEDFLADLWLEESAMKQLAAELGAALPRDYLGKVKVPLDRQRARDFRRELVGKAAAGVGELFDAILYRSLPFVPASSFAERVEEIVTAMTDRRPEKVSTPRTDLVSSRALYSACLEALVALEGPSSAVDLAGQLIRFMRRLGLVFPSPVLFADTNWTQENFGFLVSPGTGQLELWRSDPIGLDAAPMARWKSWVDGSSQIPWVIYPNRRQYTALQ
jgi:hypothetical protein